MNSVAGPNWLATHRGMIEHALQAKLKATEGPSAVLNEAMAYALLNGGKRLRALLVFASAQAVGVPASQLTDAACAVEAVHAYSLVHDDLPCMDDDVLRRGQPTCHVKFGQANALLAGDALQTVAFQWLAESTQAPSPVLLSQLAALAAASGVQGMAAGQAIDLAHVGKAMDLDALQAMHARKTGDLIAASVRLGYLAQPGLGAQQKACLEQFAKSLGLAYQVIDDILDVESSSEELGKTSGKDALNNKPTVVSLMGLDPAKAWLAKLTDQALQSLQGLDSHQRSALEALVELITKRKS